MKASDGDPKGVSTWISRAFSSPSMRYKPLPPMTPMAATEDWAMESGFKGCSKNIFVCAAVR
jgi:hypothetical protein